MEKGVIFEPLQFRHLKVKNRIFRANISGRIDNYDRLWHTRAHQFRAIDRIGNGGTR